MTLDLNFGLDIDKVLGTPSSQKILRFMTIWETLTFQKLLEFTNLSSSQVQSTLNNLIEIGIINRSSKGNYKLSQLIFTSKLKETYDIFHIRLIDKKLSDIEDLVKKNRVKESFPLFEEVSVKYKPILEKFFSHRISNIGHNILDRIQS